MGGAQQASPGMRRMSRVVCLVFVIFVVFTSYSVRSFGDLETVTTDYDLSKRTFNHNDTRQIQSMGLQAEIARNMEAGHTKKHIRKAINVTETQTVDKCARYWEAVAMSRNVTLDVLGAGHGMDINDSAVTLITHMTVERLEPFKLLLKHWKGPVSVSVYINSSSSNGFLEKLNNVSIVSNRNDILMHLVEMEGEYYPINFLRNVALNQTKTRYIFMDDVDLVPPDGAHERLKKYITHGLNKRVLVIPAFEENKTTSNLMKTFPSRKEDLIHQWRKGNVQPSLCREWIRGHAPTNYEKWNQTTSLYQVNYTDYYEPYIVAEKANLPLYDEGFLGHYYDKLSQIKEIKAMGYEFQVIPDIFIVHIGHHRPNRKHKRSYFRCSRTVWYRFEKRIKLTYGTNKPKIH